MELHLVRHGEAAPESAEPERRFAARGREEVERVGRAAAWRLRRMLTPEIAPR